MPVLIVFALLALVMPSSQHRAEQQPPPDLVVTMHAASGVALPQITVIVRDASAGQVITTQATDGDGQAIFASLPVSAVRVQVRGTMPGGAVLYQPGQDSDGIALLLGPAPNRLDLVVEDDGLVRPDPTTMLAPDAAGAPITPMMPAPSATIIPGPRPALPATVIVPTSALFGGGAAATDNPATSSRWWLVAALLATFLTCLLIAINWLRRTP